MSIYSGSLGLSKYRVVGSPGRQTHESLSKLMESFKAPPLRIDGPSKPELMGWVRPLTPTDEENPSELSHWDMSDGFTSEGYLLRLRYERRKVSSALCQMIFRTKAKEALEKTGKALTRAEKRTLKEEIALDLLKRTLPAIQYIDALWNVDGNELFVFSTSKSARQKIEDLFHKSFGAKLELSLVRLDGPAVIFDDDDSTEQELTKKLSKLSSIEPSVFAIKASH